MTDSGTESSSESLKRIDAAIDPLRSAIHVAYRRFIIGGLLSVVIATAIVWPFAMVPVPARALVWVILVAIGTTIAHRELGRISDDAGSRVQSAALDIFGLEFRGDLSRDTLKSPFDLMGLLPEGEKVTYGRRYERPPPDGIIVQEIEVQEVQIQTVRPRGMRIAEHWRTKFYGQGVEADLPDCKSEPFVLVPRRTPLSSLQIDARNRFLGEPFVRDMSLSQHLLGTFQVWQPEPLAGQGQFSDDITDAALEIAALFPRNRVWLGVAPTSTNAPFVLRMTTDIGRLYRDDSAALAAIDRSVIAKFHSQLSRLLWSIERLKRAVAVRTG